MSFVDLNRAGVALMEIVSRPDLRSSEEARAFLTKLRTILRYLGTCDGDMEKGNLRADVNVSVRRPGEPLGTRCEIKNVNSIRFVGQAIEHEARRQIAIIEDGGTIDQETRLFDPDKGETRSMRSKEEAHDYRYFPDPDLLPLELDQAWVDALQAALPELPDAKKARFVADYGLTRLRRRRARRRARDGRLLRGGGQGPRRQDRRQLGDQRARSAASTARARRSATARSRPAQLGAIIDLIASGAISGKIAKDVFEIVWSEGGDPGGNRREPRPEAGHRHRRDRDGRRRDRRRQSRQGGAGQGEAGDARLVRRPGDEGDRRQGQSAGGQRVAQGEARHLIFGRVRGRGGQIGNPLLGSRGGR